MIAALHREERDPAPVADHLNEVRAQLSCDRCGGLRLARFDDVVKGSGGFERDRDAVVVRLVRFDAKQQRGVRELSGGVFESAAEFVGIGRDAKTADGLVELLGMLAARAIAGFIK